MNLEIIEKDGRYASNGVESNDSKAISNGRRLLAVSLTNNNRPRSTDSRLSQPRPSVWTLKDIQKVLPKQGPTSLFILKENNPIRRYARMVADSKYPFINSTSLFDAIFEQVDLISINLAFQSPASDMLILSAYIDGLAKVF